MRRRVHCLALSFRLRTALSLKCFNISFFPLLAVRPTQKGWLPITFVGFVATPLKVPAAYHDGGLFVLCQIIFYIIR